MNRPAKSASRYLIVTCRFGTRRRARFTCASRAHVAVPDLRLRVAERHRAGMPLRDRPLVERRQHAHVLVPRRRREPRLLRPLRPVGRIRAKHGPQVLPAREHPGPAPLAEHHPVPQDPRVDRPRPRRRGTACRQLPQPPVHRHARPRPAAAIEQQVIIHQDRHPVRDHRPGLDIPGFPAHAGKEGQLHEGGPYERDTTRRKTKTPSSQGTETEKETLHQSEKNRMDGARRRPRCDRQAPFRPGARPRPDRRRPAARRSCPGKHEPPRQLPERVRQSHRPGAPGTGHLARRTGQSRSRSAHARTRSPRGCQQRPGRPSRMRTPAATRGTGTGERSWCACLPLGESLR